MNLNYLLLCVPIFTLTLNINANDGARILALFPNPYKSHFTCNNAVVRNLIEAGHEVAMVTSFPQQAAKENYTTIIDVSEGLPIYVGRLSIKELKSFTVMDIYESFGPIEIEICDKLLKMKEFQDLVNSKKNHFDVIFVEILYQYRCYAGLARKLNIPIIGIVTLRSWLYADQEIANPFNPSYLPYEMGMPLNLENFPDRILNLWNVMVWNYFLYTRIYVANTKFYEDYFQDQMSWSEFMSIRPSLMFYNSHFSYLPRPLNPNAIEIGGIHLEEYEVLPQKIQQFLDEAKNGAILFTLGTLVSENSMSEKIRNSFIEAFSKIPQRVIWKYNGQIENCSENIMLLKWLPQFSILGHKNVKAFISHCGQGALHETIFSGVPVIAIPLNFDQFTNAAILEKLQVAIQLDYDTITAEGVLEALNEIINDTRYSENMQKLSHSFKDRSVSPKEAVIYWTEYVIRHKGVDQLQNAAVQLYWFQYYLLDVILFVILILFILIYLCYKVFKMLFLINLFIVNKRKIE